VSEEIVDCAVQELGYGREQGVDGERNKRVAHAVEEKERGAASEPAQAREMVRLLQGEVRASRRRQREQSGQELESWR
jgi:hypothetical protein